MADLRNRAYRLVVGAAGAASATEIDARSGANDGLRISFNVARDDKRTPNNAEIRIYNLNPAAAQALVHADAVSVSLEAGYVDDVGQIFLGDLRSCKTRREGADLVTTISGGDGEGALRTARINKTFPAGTPVATVLKGLADALGVGKGNAAAAAAGLGVAKLSKARTLSGLVFDELEAFCRTQGLRWSVQDSALQIRTEGLPVLPSTGPLLRRDSGLIGEPEVEKNATVSRSGSVSEAKAGAKKAKGTVVSGSALLRPDLIPGVAFRVESTSFSGNLVCIQTTHTGDSHSTDWYVNWVGKPYG